MDKILIQAGRKYLLEMGFAKEASSDKMIIEFLGETKEKEGMEDLQKMAGTTWDTLKEIWGSYHGEMSKLWEALNIKDKDMQERLSGMVGLGIPLAGMMSMTTPRYSNQTPFGRGMAGLGLGALAGYFGPQLAKNYLKPWLNK